MADGTTTASARSTFHRPQVSNALTGAGGHPQAEAVFDSVGWQLALPVCRSIVVADGTARPRRFYASFRASTSPHFSVTRRSARKTGSTFPHDALEPVDQRKGETMAKVAFLGLGVMGYPMARHLKAKGHEVTVYNRTAAKADRWVSENGGRAARTARGGRGSGNRLRLRRQRRRSASGDVRSGGRIRRHASRQRLRRPRPLPPRWRGSSTRPRRRKVSASSTRLSPAGRPEPRTGS